MVKYLESYYGAMDPQYNSAMSASVWRNTYFGAPTPASKALQLPEIAKLGMSGIQNVEIGVIDPQHWEAIPRQHFEQMKQLAKLQLGKQSMLSVHAPIQPDPGGFRENQWSEETRRFAQEFLKDVVDKAHEIQVDENVPVPITIHGSTQAAVQWKWDPDAVDEKTGKKGALRKEAEFLVDPVDGKVVPIQAGKRYYPTGEKIFYKIMTEEEKAKAKPGDTITIDNESFLVKDKFTEVNESLWKSEKDKLTLYLTEMAKAKKEGTTASPADKHLWEMKERVMAENFQTELVAIFDKLKRSDPKKAEAIEKAANKNPLTAYYEMMKYGEPSGYGAENVPATLVRIEDFAEKQAAKTFSELAFHSFDKYGEKGPFISVENWNPSQAMGRAEGLKKGIDEARRLFAKKLVEEKKLSQEKADAIAAEKIKATWDIGHINILKSFGVPKEASTKEFWEKHLEKEIKDIEKYIGHIHISDNFGYQDVHLPPGMGNTPIKEFLEHMEKTGKLGKVKSILESAGAAIHLGIPPSHTEALTYLNVPLYPGISTPAQTWGTIGSNYFFGGAGEAGGYTSGYGKFLPEGHFGEYGTGFSQLPYAFGGVRPGTEGQQSKFSGTPMS